MSNLVALLPGTHRGNRILQTRCWFGVRGSKDAVHFDEGLLVQTDSIAERVYGAAKSNGLELGVTGSKMNFALSTFGVDTD